MSRILIADDDLGILEAMAALLSRCYEVETARDGEEALEKLGRGPVDLIVLDLLMPLLDGESALVKIRASGYRGAIIVMSAHADRLVRTRSLGADDFVVKPFEFRELERMIEQLLPRESGGPASRSVPSAGHRGAHSA
jgi:DNA-binding response OmpR family regulator